MVSTEKQLLCGKMHFLRNAVDIVSELHRRHAGVTAFLIHLVTCCFNQQRASIICRLRKCCLKHQTIR